jgi:hypothetical protein
MRSDGPTLGDATYRIYNVMLNDHRLVYTAAGRFKVENGSVWVLADPTGILARYAPSGPLTVEKRWFLASYVRGSYRHVVVEQPGVTYLPTCAQHHR